MLSGQESVLPVQKIKSPPQKEVGGTAGQGALSTVWSVNRDCSVVEFGCNFLYQQDTMIFGF